MIGAARKGILLAGIVLLAGLLWPGPAQAAPVKIYLNPESRSGVTDPFGLGYDEKVVTGNVAARLARMLGEHGFFEVRIGGSGDLAAVAEANSWGADRFLSIRSNVGGGSLSGTVTYIRATGGASEVFAGRVQRYTHDYLNSNNMGLRTAPADVTLGTASMPALRVALLFRDNPADVRLLLNPDVQETAAMALYRAIADSVGVPAGFTGTRRSYATHWYGEGSASGASVTSSSNYVSLSMSHSYAADNKTVLPMRGYNRPPLTDIPPVKWWTPVRVSRSVGGTTYSTIAYLADSGPGDSVRYATYDSRIKPYGIWIDLTPTVKKRLGDSGTGNFVVDFEVLDGRFPRNLAFGRPVQASSTAATAYGAHLAADGNETYLSGDAGYRSTWKAASSPGPQWINVDLGAPTEDLSKVVVKQGRVYAARYDVNLSLDGVNWWTVRQETRSNGGTDIVNFAPARARYVGVLLHSRSSTTEGNEVVELEVYQGTRNLAAGKPALASSTIRAGFEPARAVDSSAATRWSSTFADNQWFHVDLGSSRQVGKVVLRWEEAFARTYDISVSNDRVNWYTVKSISGSSGGSEMVSFTPVSARYVGVNLRNRATPYGFSLWEFEVYER